MLRPGLYEQLISRALRRELDAVPPARRATAPVDPAEAAEVLSRYVAEATRRALTGLGEGRGLADQIGLVNRMIGLLPEPEDERVDGRAEQLTALLAEGDPALALGRTAGDLARPETSLAQSSLFTGAAHEPQMFSELRKEIAGADRVDMLVSFIRWSGLRLIWDALASFTRRGGALRVITTSYMGATDIRAVEELAALPNTQIRVSYDTKRTRLHAKTYVFHRDTGFTTAYVGSSNLSGAAVSSGLEWNLKVTQKDQPATIRKIEATFDTYWHADEFEPYGPDAHERRAQALRAERGGRDRPRFLFDIRPYPYQQEILDALRAEREVRGVWRNLIVAATGTGKTVIAAFDYSAFRRQNPGGANRLLFVAHREEILRQSRETFAGILKDANFGELWVGGCRPDSLDHLFVSVQTLNAQSPQERLPADYYDYIVIDETHHAAAPSYAAVLGRFTPKILLGLTATPERMDGQDIYQFFDHRIAAEIRLPEAIDRRLLCPFQYFGVSDTVDLDGLRWTRGGYDRAELSRLYTLSRATAQKRADHILSCMIRYVTDMDEVKALGFCVSVEHARFMAEHFTNAGVTAQALTGDSPDAERAAARDRLVSGAVRVLFVVDIYNEGVDIPEVNTVLFLRPTESLTIFLQQLGRGLRLAEGKDCLTVLDFIGAANRRYNFAEKFAAMLDRPDRSVERELRRGFVNVPKGCFIQLEKRAAEIVLENIRKSLSARAGLVSRIASFQEDSGQALTLANFLRYHHMDIRTIYARDSFSRLCVEAGVREDFAEPAEEALRKAFLRLCAVDSRRWIGFLVDILSRPAVPDPETLDGNGKRMLNMFYVTVWQEAIDDFTSETVRGRLRALQDSPVLRRELVALLRCRLEAIDFVDAPANLPYECPLDLHCAYTRDQLFVALDFLKPQTLREGVKWLPDKRTDVLLITLNKSEKEYSPTTMYADYSIDARLFHWQSQSTTGEDSVTGQRYIHHRARGSHVLLFVREEKTESGAAAPYTFLGEADYVSHTGSKPMNIVWRLRQEIPARFLRRTQQVIG